MSRSGTSTLAALALSAVIGLASGSVALAGHGGGHGGGGHGGGGHGGAHFAHMGGHMGHFAHMGGHVGHFAHMGHFGHAGRFAHMGRFGTFALPVIGRIAIGPGAIPGTVTFGPLAVGITERVGSTGLGDGSMFATIIGGEEIEADPRFRVTWAAAPTDRMPPKRPYAVSAAP